MKCVVGLGGYRCLMECLLAGRGRKYQQCPHRYAADALGLRYWPSRLQEAVQAQGPPGPLLAPEVTVGVKGR